MLQFLLGTSTVNVNWLFESMFGGARLYNSPPLFFIGGFALLATRFYSFSIRPEVLRIVGVVGAIGILSAILHGFGPWHLRQTIAFIVAAVVWIFVYQEAWTRDIFTLDRTKKILIIYLIYFAIVSAERLIETKVLPYIVSCVFSYHCGANVGYISSGRFPFFSDEPSLAVMAIAATIMPFLCANAIVNRTRNAYGLFALGCLLLFYSEGITAQLLILFSFSFVIFPRFSVASVPGLMLVIVAVAASVSYVLAEPGGITYFVQHFFSGYYSRIDEGIQGGSYVSRVMNWLIGARAFISSPWIGTGFGGTQAYFYHLYDAGFYVIANKEQVGLIQGDGPAYNSPMVVRIPAAIGIIGTAFLVYYGWRAMRLGFKQDDTDPMLHYAYLYSLGAMLLGFCTNSSLLDPGIPAFVALLAQRLRAQDAIAPSPSPSPALLPAPDFNPSGA